MDLKISTLNCCLGIKSKKETIKSLAYDNKIDIFCMQEIELENGYSADLLSFPNYRLEVESNVVKSRVGVYISNNVQYVRRQDLEGMNAHLIVIDIKASVEVRIINIYRCFNPQEGITSKEKFLMQLNLIKSAITQHTILLGDFNIDYSKRFDAEYRLRGLFGSFDEFLGDVGLIQMVNFPTWSRVVQNTYRDSILDHVYCLDPCMIENMHDKQPTFGDHRLVVFSLQCGKSKVEQIMRRDWRKYSKDLLNSRLASIEWHTEIDSVQQYWNVFEQTLVSVVDEIAPMVPFVNNNVSRSQIPALIKNKLNKRRRLLRTIKIRPCNLKRDIIKKLNLEIRYYFNDTKKTKVRRGILPGNTKSLWDAVRIAHDKNIEPIPRVMFKNNNEVNYDSLPDEFAEFFDSKVKNIVNSVTVNSEVYNGQKLVNSGDSMFMDTDAIISVVGTMKVKNSEGFDRIPQRVIREGINHLLKPLTNLFKLIYTQKQIPEQWLVAKTVPIHKKGPRKNIENYRPIANLCSSSKIFEKLILKRMLDIQDQAGVDLTGKEQYGFKKGKSTLSLGLKLQSLISRALDESNYALMASIDLSAAFDVVNIPLLLVRLKIIGLPSDIIELIKVWLTGRSYYVSINGNNSVLFDLDHGTVQGSILGPILYAIYVSPMFHLVKMSSFADDSYTVLWDRDKLKLARDMEEELMNLTKWLKDSGLKVNEQKTEMVLFYKKDCLPITITLNQIIIRSIDCMNVLGVKFDSKLQWSRHVSHTITRANGALNAIRLIRRYFTSKELLTLVTANYYSILYYNSEIWHIPNLKPQLKQMLMSVSAKALKLCMKNPEPRLSFDKIHEINKRATPHNLMIYKHSLLLHKLYNQGQPSTEWVNLHFQHQFSMRQGMFTIAKTNLLKIGNNIMVNRLSCLNQLIPLDWLNFSYIEYKLKMKNKFLK